MELIKKHPELIIKIIAGIFFIYCCVMIIIRIFQHPNIRFEL